MGELHGSECCDETVIRTVASAAVLMRGLAHTNSEPGAGGKVTAD